MKIIHVYAFAMLGIVVLSISGMTMSFFFSHSMSKVEISTHCRAVAVQALDLGLPAASLRRLRMTCVEEWTRDN